MAMGSSHAALQCYTVCPDRGKTVRDEDLVVTTIAPDARIAGAQRTYPPRSAVVSWIFFDWAAQPYFTLITTFVFAPYFATGIAPNPAIHGFLRPEASAMAPSTGDISAIARPAAAIAKPHNDWPVAASGAMLVAK
jgi:UMF1 family MFS transporter